MEKYDPQKIELKWQKIWEDSKLYEAKDEDPRPKFYCLDMFPYPSGEGLHVGHWRGYVLSDIWARYAMLNGKNVLHPMGWDAFGLPAENAAIKNHSHPKIFTDKAIETFKKQLHQIGVMFDWSREINTSDPTYYKWTQWLFLKLYENGLAYRKAAPVNWCPNCQTVLANEQVVAGECERCSSQVVKKNLTQWFFKITDFAEDLLKDLDSLDWPERTKTLQRNWIGKSEGTNVEFQIPNSQLRINVFTTRADTLFGCTYLVLSPEHKEIRNLKSEIRNYNEVENYIEQAKTKSDLERTELQKDKTGVKLEGIKAINPINNQEVEVWVADYVLANYGTGAVMAVPAHDDRDFEFAKKYNLAIKQVINQKIKINPPAGVQNDDSKSKLDQAFTDYGILINSDEFNNLTSQEAQLKITQKLKSINAGDFSTNYKLRDWLISRQRYWGAPIPIIYCDKCGIVPVPEKDLPVMLPQDIEFEPHGDSPLKQSQEFLNTKCPNCGSEATRETDTMDTFVDSSWYYLRYADPKNNQILADKQKLQKWLPVDLYVGGIEHAILHLLYARFVSKALHKLKIVNFSPNGEPFTKLFNIGMIYLHGSKMSKSKGNIVSPNELIEKYGTDALRGYELFIGPAEIDSEWQINGITGIYRFLEKVWSFYRDTKFIETENNHLIIEQTIKKVTLEIKLFKPNTALSALMELFNALKKEKDISKSCAIKINILLAPFFPHLAEEIWQSLGNKDSIFRQIWPTYDESISHAQKVALAVQINGKTKGVIEINNNLDQKQVEEIISKDAKLNSLIENKKIVKTIYIAGRVINFVLN